MNTLRTIVIAFLAGLAGAYAFFNYQLKQGNLDFSDDAQYNVASYEPEDAYKPTIVLPRANSSLEGVDFSNAATNATQSVVYINSISKSGSSYSYWDLLFSGRPQTQVSSGSGVIFTSDGYIVTNNHVVETAEQIQVMYNKKVYDAELIGTDPSTDLAVLKIEEENLPSIPLGSSKNLSVGEWVIAVGNPFSLSSTVTAGIVSAKGRRINIVEDKFPIESFIQTDAAINPGNSGGALVNKDGELVGINTAILSRTGSYTGYAFAVPIDIAKKIVGDLVKYGIVQKSFFGGNVVEYDYQNAKKYDLNTDVKDFNGVLLAELDKTGVAKNAGLKLGDIIVKIDDVEINSKSEFEEELSYHSPGEKISVTYVRNNKRGTTSLTLLNKNGDTNLIKRKFYNDATIGATLEAVDYGVKVFKISNGLFRKIGVPENYTIISINRQRVSDPQDVIDFFNKYKGRVVVYGITSAKEERPLSFILQ
ncbi:MAG: trypsin-like peptidase domain-containing protein [Cyclobacteriaceae bacterium]